METNTTGICPFAEWRPVASHTFNAGSVHRVGFCDHTAGGYYSTLRDPNFWNNQGYSVHFAIARDGRVAQLVNIFDRAFGQGRLGPKVTWEPYLEMGRINPNEYLISTEHEDIEKGVFIPGPIWTDAMYAADLAVKRWCVDEVRRARNQDLLVFGEESLSGHYMFDGVNRANCPGSPWKNDYRSRLYGQLASGDDEVRIEHDRTAGFLLNNAFNASAPFYGRQGVNAAYDFELPSDAKYIELLVEAEKGFARFYSGAGNHCGDVGWGKVPGTPDQSIITVGLSEKDPTGVNPTPGKWFLIDADDITNKVKFLRVKSIAYIK